MRVNDFCNPVFILYGYNHMVCSYRCGCRHIDMLMKFYSNLLVIARFKIPIKSPFHITFVHRQTVCVNVHILSRAKRGSNKLDSYQMLTVLG